MAGEYDIHVGAYRFDPLEGPPEVPEALASRRSSLAGRPTDRPEPVIVQFQGPISEQDRARLTRQYGLRLRAFLPNLAYLEHLSPSAVDALETDEFVRAVVPFQPAFKLSPSIGQLPHRGEHGAVQVTLLEAALFDDADPSAVTSRVRDAGAEAITVIDTRPAGGWLGIRFTLDDLTNLEQIAQIEDVHWIEEVPDRIIDSVFGAGTNQSGIPGTRSIWDRGLRGEGQIIGVIDEGPIDLDHCFFMDPENNNPGLAHRKVLDLRDPGAPSAHATLVAGYAAGDNFNSLGTAPGRGGAWAAMLVSGSFSFPASMFDALTLAGAAGARIHTNSWHEATAGAGQPANYTFTARGVDVFTWNNEDHLVLGSSGNIGNEQGPPGTAKNALCVSASQSHPNEMNFGNGNPGPTADDRRKPDIVGVGCDMQGALVGTDCDVGLPTSIGFVNDCGTSWATPHVAAAAALIRQYFVEGWYPTGERTSEHALTPSGALLKAVLLNSTVDMTGVADYPNVTEGWGRIRLEDSLFFAGDTRKLRIWDVWNARGLTTGKVGIHTVDVIGSGQPLKITLVWTDAPPDETAFALPVVNNLDLRVISANTNESFFGNHFVNGESGPGGVPDVLNNVEMVLVKAPAEGRWIIRITATKVSWGNPGQGYALVVSGDLRTGPCFVASSVYGDVNHPDVTTLQAWRDKHLDPEAKARTAMRALVAVYGRMGPPLAVAIRRHPSLSAGLRRFVLAPFVAILRRRSLNGS